MMKVTLREALWIAALLGLLWTETGCVAELSPVGESGSPSRTVTSTTAEVLTSRLPASPSPTCTAEPKLTPTHTSVPTPSQAPTQASLATPSQTPSVVPSPTVQPIPDLTELNNAWVFYTTVILEYAQQRNADELKKTTELWQVMADGSGRKRLLSERLEGEWNSSLDNIRLSHSGRNLVFIRFVDKRATTIWSSSLWVMDVNGSHLRELVSQSPVTPGCADWLDENEIAFSAKLRPMFPAWSPDDSSIAFVDWLTFSHGEPGMVHILDAKTEKWQAFGEGEAYAWSPDGSALAIYSERSLLSAPTLRIVNLKGETVFTVAVPPSTFLKSLDRSASTGLIVAQGANYEKQVYPIFVIDPESSTVETVVDNGNNVWGFGPRWSPDGEMISFGHTVGDSTDLHILDLSSGDKRLIMPQVESQGVWSPDSTSILVQSRVQGNGLYVVRVSGGQHWKIPDLSGDNEDLWFSSYDWLFPVP